MSSWRIIPNWLVALSNLYGIYLALSNRCLVYRMDCILMMSCAVASFLMHLSDTKHYQRGVAPFNQPPYSSYLLNADRVLAALAILRILYIILSFPYVLDVVLLPGVVGFCMLAISESKGEYSSETSRVLKLIVFVVAHCMWHVIAFDCLAEASLMYFEFTEHPFTFVCTH